ncbi:TetR/AcrR family transcriptional regulator [Cryptosporangium phraense]|uniref:TetR family transcriptional regulator n=1 Tax=Cryptosporangium phraense TaxID=2593070 RepID=A0A545AGK6_9ACTN|nr:TetR/AcrR family transcriptional regulator C-terminal domain-containing protein [Cryptosporangium phraense]TQS40453.1 TetR family transcriptional regulator [Cryptosporangium phraense]
MPGERSSAGDPARTLALLWRGAEPVPPPSRGPRPTLTVDRVVTVAVALADAEGLAAVTMRRIATDLSVAPMTLYTYVPGKAELLDLMLDAVYAAIARTTPADASWRARVGAVADDNRALYERHPWLAEISTSRPPLGPGAIAKYEYELGAFDDAGLDDVTRDAALTFVLGFVETCARGAAAARAAARESARSDEDWWAESGPLLAKVFDADRFPRAARIGSAAGEAQNAAYSADHAYDFGRARLLDGLSALIDA